MLGDIPFDLTQPNKIGFRTGRFVLVVSVPNLSYHRALEINKTDNGKAVSPSVKQNTANLKILMDQAPIVQ